MAQFLSDLAYGDDHRQRLDLYLPERSDPRLFVFIHGGGWRGGSKDEYRALGELLVQFGYAVALPNHRLAPQHPYPAAAEDIAAALGWLCRSAPESGIRTQGIILAGHSSGAHLAALVALHPRLRALAGLAPSAFAGVIGISGIYDIEASAAASPEYLGPVFGDAPGTWADASPLRHARAGAAPFLLAHAEFDYPGAAGQAAAMAQALDRAGGAADVVAVPGRDHVTILSGVRSLFDPLAMRMAIFLRAVQAGGGGSEAP